MDQINATDKQTTLTDKEIRNKESAFVFQAWQVMQLADRDMDGVLTKEELAAGRQNGALKNIDKDYLDILENDFDSLKDLSDEEYFGDSGISSHDLSLLAFGSKNLSYGHFASQNAQDNIEAAAFVGITLGMLAEGAVWLVSPKRAIALHLGGAIGGAINGYSQSYDQPLASQTREIASHAITGGVAYGALLTTGTFMYGTSRIHENYWSYYAKPGVKKLFSDIHGSSMP